MMSTLSLQMILRATRGRLLSGPPAGLVEGVSIDSRTLHPGELFVPIRGHRFDGHDFIGEAVRRGARAVLTNRHHGPPGRGNRPAEAPQCSLIQVEDTAEALLELAAFYRRQFPIDFIGVTGSNGKTTTKEMLASILGITRKVLKNEGNLNNLYGMPLTLLRLDASVEVAVLEMGMNRRGEIRRLCQVAAPTAGLVTNISAVHLEFLGSIENVAQAKGELVESLDAGHTLALNADDPLCLGLRRWTPARVVSYGFEAAADVRGGEVEDLGLAGTRFSVRCFGGPAFLVRVGVPGLHNAYNALAAVAAAAARGYGAEEMQKGLEGFTGVARRGQVRDLGCGVTVYADYYNANPEAVRRALLTVRNLASGARTHIVLADMLELGDTAPHHHEEVGAQVASLGFARLWASGHHADDVARGALSHGLPDDQIVVAEEPAALLAPLLEDLREGDWVLLKGSRGMHLEGFFDRLTAALGEA